MKHKRKLGFVKKLESETHGNAHSEDDEEQQRQKPCGGSEFVLYKLSQHLNTSLKRASTLLPSFSRISSTVLRRTILP